MMRNVCWLPLVLALSVFAAEQKEGGRTEAAPEEWQGVGITEHLNAPLPLDTPFLDETSRSVTLGQYFRKDRPVLLALIYFRCPMLCNLILNGMVDAMKQQRWTAGKEYECVVVSFDPLETPQLAFANKERFLQAYERPESAPGVHFLTGKRDDIKRLADALGFAYKWSEREKQYMHQAAIYTCTPDGRISHYLYGVQFDSQTLRFSLVDAAEGKSGTLGDRVAMFCFSYDPTTHKYSLSALRVMQAAGAATVLLIASVLGAFWLREARRRKQSVEKQTELSA